MNSRNRTATDLLTPPRPGGWDRRADWLAAQQRRRAVDPGLCHGPQAAALMAEMARAYCAGTYAAVILLAQAVLDAEMAARSAVAHRLQDGASTTLGFGHDHLWLRQYRNRLAHGINDQGEINFALTVDDLGENHQAMETSARRAINLVFDALLEQASGAH